MDRKTLDRQTVSRAAGTDSVDRAADLITQREAAQLVQSRNDEHLHLLHFHCSAGEPELSSEHGRTAGSAISLLRSQKGSNLGVHECITFR